MQRSEIHISDLDPSKQNEDDIDEDDILTQSLLEPARSKSHAFINTASFRKKSSPLFNDEAEEDIFEFKDLNFKCKDTRQKDGEKLLFKLQEMLHREILLLEKEQAQKRKLRGEIESEMDNYYSLMINSQDSEDHIVKNDGFDNCYNFIKEIVVNVSKFYKVGLLLLMNCTITQNQHEKDSVLLKDYRELVKLCVNVFYERVEETDPFLKMITKLVCALLQKVPELEIEENKQFFEAHSQQELAKTVEVSEIKYISLSSLQTYYLKLNQGSIEWLKEPKEEELIVHTNFEKVNYFFNLYMEKQEIKNYFEILSSEILKKIEKVTFSKAISKRKGMSVKSKGILIEGDDSFQIDKKSSNPSSSFLFDPEESDWLEYNRPFQTIAQQKRALAMIFLASICSEADLAPNSLKIPLKYLYEAYRKHFKQNEALNESMIKKICSLKIWQIIEPYYLKGIHTSNTQNFLIKSMTFEEKEKLEQVREIIENFLKIKQRQECAGSHEKLLQTSQKSITFIVSVVDKLLTVNEQKYSKLKGEMNEVPIVESLDSFSNLNRSRTISEGKQQTLNTSIDKSKEGEKLSSQNTGKSTISESQLVLPAQLIKIYGGCISFKQLYILLNSLRMVSAKIPNERIVSRVTRIFNMSPSLDIFLPSKPQQSKFKYVVLTQLEYHELIEDDYRKIYGKEYENDRVKNITRQIICEMRLNELEKKFKRGDMIYKRKINPLQTELNDFKMMKKENFIHKEKAKKEDKDKFFTNILKKISECVDKPGNMPIQLKNMSIQTKKKIKYLLWLFEKNQIRQKEILSEMLEQVRFRSTAMSLLYEHTKFGLLAVIGNIKYYKHLLISRKQSEKKIMNRIKYIQRLQRIKLSLCLTSPYNRSNPTFDGNEPEQKEKEVSSPSRSSFIKGKQTKIEQSIANRETELPFAHESGNFNKYKYRMSNADEIMLFETEECIHKDNILLGLSYHFSSVLEFIDMFCKLREVSECIYFATFIIDKQISEKVYQQILELNGKSSSFRLPRESHNYHFEYNVFQSQKYSRISFSPDKINRSVFNFIKMLIFKNKQKPSQKSTNEESKMVCDIIFRGIHEKLVKKRQKNLVQNRSRSSLDSSNRGSLVLADIQDQSPPQERKKTKTPKVFSDLTASPIRLQRYSSKSQKDIFFKDDSFSHEEFEANDDNFGLEGKKSIRESFSKRMKMEVPLSQTQELDTLIYQTRNDQILLYQIKKINNFIQTRSVDPLKFQFQTSNSSQIHIKQIEEVCSRCKEFTITYLDIKNLNTKENPEDKIESLKNISQIYKLVIKRKLENKKDITSQTSRQNGQKTSQCHQQSCYSLQKLIFMATLLAAPTNFITNLAFIELFLPRDRLLSMEGKILNQFKIVIKKMFTLDIGEYFQSAHSQDLEELKKIIKSGLSNQSIFNDGELKADLDNIKKNLQREI